MPTQLIPFGLPVTMVTNQVYALPTVVKATGFCSDAAPTMEQSNDITFAVKAAVTFTAGIATLVGSFIRATTGTPTIILTRD
jgi:hypothetical protein